MYRGQAQGCPPPQREFLDYMRHREPKAWHEFMDRYRGLDLRSMPMHELEGRFFEMVHRTHDRFQDPCQTPPKPKKLTWFEEIQAEVNEWLKEIN